MGRHSNKELMKYLPLVLAATFIVVVLPVALVFWLRRAGTVESAWTGAAIGIAASLALSQVGAAAWKRHGASDLMFSELMLWGWVRRWRSERRLTAAADLLGVGAGTPDAITGGQLTSEQKSSLLTQLTSSLEARDPYTHGHSRRVARHAANIARQMGLPAAEVATIRAAGAMHDVGKVDTPAAVLQKTGELTEHEYAIVKRHPGDGADMVATLNDDELTDTVRHHHERLDGTGYPDGLAGQAIPLGARILAVADTFDAITSTRPYRQANSHKKALDILAAEAGTQLDPDAVQAFREYYSGRRPLAIWTVVANARPQLAARLGDAVSPAAATNVVATAATAAAVGAAAIGPAAVASPEVSRSPAPAVATAPTASAGSPMIRSASPTSTLMARFEASGRSGGGVRDDALESATREGTKGEGVSATAEPSASPRSTIVLPRSQPRVAPAERPAAVTAPAPAATPAPVQERPVRERRPRRGKRRGHGRTNRGGRPDDVATRPDRVRPGQPPRPGKPAKPRKPAGPNRAKPPVQGQQQAPAEPKGNGNGNAHGQDRPR